jgi:hypothetical protein
MASTDMATTTPLWIAAQPTRYAADLPLPDSYESPFVGAQWESVSENLGGFKIFSGTIYQLAAYGYTRDSTYGGHYYPAAALELVELLTDLSTLNGGQLNPNGLVDGIPIYMESPVLKPGVLPNGAHYNSAIEGFDGSFNGVMGYIRNSLHYAVTTGRLSLAQAKAINIKYIAMDEPLFFASIYKSPKDWVVDGVKIQSPQWSIEEVARQAAVSLKEAKDILGIYDPGLRFGDIEPFPYVTATQVDQFAQAFETSARSLGINDEAAKLAFFQADVVWGRPGWQQNLQEVSAVLSARGIPLDIIINGNGSEKTPVEWTDNALNALIAIKSLPNLDYQSLSIQNWHFKLDIALFDEHSTDNSPGTLTNVAKYIPSLDYIKNAYLESAPTLTPTAVELFYAVRSLSTSSISHSELTSALVDSVSIRTSLGFYKSISAAPPSVADLMAGRTPNELLESSPSIRAAVYAPVSAPLLIPSINYLPKASSGVYYLKNVSSPNSLGALYLHSADNLKLQLPDKVSTVLNFIPDSENKERGEVFVGAGNSYIYVASGQNSFILSSPNTIIVDASGSGASVVLTSETSIATTVRGDDGTIASLRVSNAGHIQISPSSENLQLQVASGSTVGLSGNQNVEILVGDSAHLLSGSEVVGSAVRAFASPNMPLFHTISSDSQSVINRSTNVLSINVPIAFSSAKIDGGGRGAVVNINGTGTIAVDAGNRNVLYQIQEVVEITLNDDRLSGVSLMDNADNSIVTLGAAGQHVYSTDVVGITVRSNTSFITDETKLVVPSGTLIINGGGEANIGSNIVGISTLQINESNHVGPLHVTVSEVHGGVDILNHSSNATVRVGSPSQSIHNLSGSILDVEVSTRDAEAAIFGGTGGIRAYFEGGGEFHTQVMERGRIVLSDPSVVFLNENHDLHTLIPEYNSGINEITLKSSGQSVYVQNHMSNIIHTSANFVGSMSGTTIEGNGMTKLMIYKGGEIFLGRETTGLHSIQMYRDIDDSPYEIALSDDQENTEVTDLMGGSRIHLSSAYQKIRNEGDIATRITASSDDANALIDGGKAGAVLEVYGGGDVVLSPELHNVIVKLADRSSVFTGAGTEVTIDAEVGSSMIVIQSPGHVVETGASNKIVDESNGSIVVQGLMSEWIDNEIRAVGTEDILHFTDLLPQAAVFHVDYHEEFSAVHVNDLNREVTFNVAGKWIDIQFEVAPDGLGGTIVNFSKLM